MRQSSAILDELQTKREELRMFELDRRTEFIDTVTGQPISAMTHRDIAELRDREKELASLDLEYREAVESERPEAIQRRIASINVIDPSTDRRSLSERFVASKEYRESKGKRELIAEIPGIELKTLMSTNSGFAPPNPRTQYVSPYPMRRPVIADAIPQDPTDLQLVKYMRGTVATQNASATSEGASKPESAFQWEEITSRVVKIAHMIPVTEEQMADVDSLRNLLDNQMLWGLQLAEEPLILNGPGGESMTGFYNTSGVQTQSLGGDTLVDAIYKAMDNVQQVGRAEPTAVMINHDDFNDVRLAKNTFGDYIWGPPSLPAPDTMWGKPVIATTIVPSGNPLTGDFLCYSHISRKRGAVVDVSNSHADYFASDILVLRAEMRESLEIYRPSAFCFVN